MTEFQQFELLLKLRVIWSHFPEWRFGQLLFNISGQYDAFFVSDDVLEQQVDLVLSGGHPRVTLP